MFGQLEKVEDRTNNNFLTYILYFTFWTISKTCHIQNSFDVFKTIWTGRKFLKIILDFLKGQCISNLKVAKSGKDECFISPNTNVIWIGVEIKVTSYYCSSPLGHEDGSQSACSDDASACWTWSLGGYYSRRKGLLCSASIMASKMVGESKAAQWNYCGL